MTDFRVTRRATAPRLWKHLWASYACFGLPNQLFFHFLRANTMITITDDDSVFVEDVITPTGRTEIVPTGGKRVEKCCRVQRNRIGFPFGRSPIKSWIAFSLYGFYPSGERHYWRFRAAAFVNFMTLLSSPSFLFRTNWNEMSDRVFGLTAGAALVVLSLGEYCCLHWVNGWSSAEWPFLFITRCDVHNKPPITSLYYVIDE